MHIVARFYFTRQQEVASVASLCGQKVEVIDNGANDNARLTSVRGNGLNMVYPLTA